MIVIIKIIDHTPNGAFQGQWKKKDETNNANEHITWLKISTGRRQTSWLFKSWTRIYRETTSAYCLELDLNLRPPDDKSGTLTIWPHWLLSNLARNKSEIHSFSLPRKLARKLPVVFFVPCFIIVPFRLENMFKRDKKKSYSKQPLDTVTVKPILHVLLVCRS